MATESQIVRKFVAILRKAPDTYSGWQSRMLRGLIHRALIKDDLTGHWWGGPSSSSRKDRDYMAERLEKRIRKKAAQPFRRKRRGPMRAKAAGKNEVTRRR